MLFLEAIIVGWQRSIFREPYNINKNLNNEKLIYTGSSLKDPKEQKVNQIQQKLFFRLWSSIAALTEPVKTFSSDWVQVLKRNTFFHYNDLS